MTKRSNFPVCVKSPGTTLKTLRRCRKETDGSKTKSAKVIRMLETRRDNDASRYYAVSRCNTSVLTSKDELSHHDSNDKPPVFARRLPTRVHLGLMKRGHNRATQERQG